MLIERGGLIFIVFARQNTLSSVSLITAKVYTKQRPSKVWSTTKLLLGEGVMDGAVVTVKEPWVKAKVFRRKKGIQMVSSPLPPIKF